MPEEEGPSREERKRMVAPGMLLGLMGFVGILGIVSAYLVAQIVRAESEFARVNGIELSALAVFYINFASVGYIGPAIMLVVVIALSNGGTKRQRLALALIAAGLFFSFAWHIGARSAF